MRISKVPTTILLVMGTLLTSSCQLYIQQIPGKPSQAVRREIESKAGALKLQRLDDCYQELESERSTTSAQRTGGTAVAFLGGLISISSGLYAALQSPQLTGSMPPTIDDKSRKVAAWFSAGGAAIALIGTYIGSAADSNKRYDAAVTAWYAGVTNYGRGEYDAMENYFPDLQDREWHTTNIPPKYWKAADIKYLLKS